MFTLRCTQKLIKRLGVNCAEAISSPTTALGDWYANVVVLAKRPVILFVSEKSLLCVLVYAKDLSNLIPRFRIELTDLLRVLGAQETAIQNESYAMTEVSFGPTKNRSVLGSLNDFVHQMRAAAEYNPNWTLSEHQLALAEIPCAPINYLHPAKQAISLLSR